MMSRAFALPILSRLWACTPRGTYKSFYAAYIRPPPKSWPALTLILVLLVTMAQMSMPHTAPSSLLLPKATSWTGSTLATATSPDYTSMPHVVSKSTSQVNVIVFVTMTNLYRLFEIRLL
jgi:hypothetical protein